MKKTFLATLLATAMLVAWAPNAMADSFTFKTNTSYTVSGTAYAVAATALFDFGGSHLTLTLSNDTQGISKTGHELVGIGWTLGEGAGITLTSVSPQDEELVCDPAVQKNCDPRNWTSPFGWGTSGDVLLAAGSSTNSWKPYAIINDTYVVNSQTKNGPHNPFLMGPVVFEFATTGTPGVPSDVMFYWGTTGSPTAGECEEVGGCTPPQVPEPASMLLLGTGLLGASYFGRKRK